MFAPLNATMLNTGPAPLGLSVFAIGNAASDAWAFRFSDFKRAEAVGVANTDNSFQRKIAGYWGSTVGIAEQISVQNNIAALYGTTFAVGTSTGQTLHKTAIGFGKWVAEAKATMEIRNATRWVSGEPTVALANQKSKAIREVIPTSAVAALADTFAWRLLASYRAADIRRTLILNMDKVTIPRLIIVSDDQIVKAFNKQPSERLDYDILGEKWLRAEDEFVEVLEKKIHKESDNPFDPLDLKEEGTVIREDGKRLKVWLSEGVDGETYLVTLKILTKHGLIKEVDFYVNVMESPYETKVC